jgi:hypothetical protein
MPVEFLGPSAAVFAAIFTGTVGLWLGTRLQLGRFKHEKAFERRVGWYERIIQALQRIRDVVWEINTSLSKMSPRRYADRAERLQELVREFQQIAAERHYAKPSTVDAIQGLGLTILSLERNIPPPQSGRKAGTFWLAQHNDWGRAYGMMSEDLQDELFRSKPNRLRRILRLKNRSSADRRRTEKGWLSAFRRKAAEVPATPRAIAPNAPHESEQQLEDEQASNIFDALWATIQRKEALEDNKDDNPSKILDAMQCTILRCADLRSLLALFNGLRNSSRPSEGWQRQHIARLLALSTSENSRQFDYILSVNFTEVVGTRSGVEYKQQLEALLKQHRGFQRQWSMKLQPLQNTILAQRYPNPNLDIQALRNVDTSEVEAIAFQQLQWLTELIGLLTRIWSTFQRTT